MSSRPESSCKLALGQNSIFFLDILFCTFQMLSSFSEISYPIFPPPCFYKGAHPHTHPLPTPCPGIPLNWGIEPCRDQGPFLPLTSNKTILCYICGWCHGSLHVHSLVGGLVSGSSGDTGCFILLFLL